ncbi:MAG: hypothetical protein Q9190_007935, partial [Brigantiaea leucoxantha]
MTNRAFTELYPVDNETAEYVETLLKLGAVIVGKSKMCSFAAGENPGDWIDFHCPFNPRGDQYQSPGSSSAGAGASLAGYSWLEYAVGTDSGITRSNTLQEASRMLYLAAGSIRAPAACNGVFGLRPSFEAASLHGVFRLSR